MPLEYEPELTYGLINKLYLCVDRGSSDAAMAEIVADRLHRQALIEEMLSRSMTQRVPDTDVPVIPRRSMRVETIAFIICRLRGLIGAFNVRNSLRSCRSGRTSRR